MSDNKSKFDRTFDGVASVSSSLFTLLKAAVAVIFLIIFFTFVFAFYQGSKAVDNLKEASAANKAAPTVSASQPPAPATVQPSPAPAVVAAPTLEQQIQVSLLKITPLAPNTLGQFQAVKLDLKLANNSDQAVSGLKVDIEVFDAFGDKINGFEYKFEKDLPPRTALDYSTNVELNPFNRSDQELATIKNWKAKISVLQAISR